MTTALRRSPTSAPTRRLFGLDVAAIPLESAVELAERAVSTRQRFLVGVLNAAKIVKLTEDALLRRSLLEADILLADGQSVVWASRLLRRPLPERVAGIDLFEALLALADRRRLRVFLLGAKPEVLDRVRAEIGRQWPGAVVCGTKDGYFPDEDSATVAAEIEEARPDLLFLGITTPKKEIFLGTYADTLGVPVLHGVGGSFDVLAGVTRRAPRLWQRFGMEWAYRVRQEPRRLWRRYLVGNLAFLRLLAREVASPRPPYLPDARSSWAPPRPRTDSPSGSVTVTTYLSRLRAPATKAPHQPSRSTTLEESS
ncbi:WecB/TagA/CpsF family glycosyltransferase [Nocardioides insulae]|uniref:WecB/TagA/CpsF family glycosyltransferase n=1 Tax=Nocardioides insulae TaxID=394734 RepID=UPI0004248D71|nr:WecB/TagA/CpsF family glycosyltransferase [Nocardioides insulae]